MSKSVAKLAQCGGKKRYKTEDIAKEAQAIMTEKYNEQFDVYLHQGHFHIGHSNPMEYSSVTKKHKWCDVCRRRYNSANYEEHCGRKYHQEVVSKHEKLRNLLDNTQT